MLNSNEQIALNLTPEVEAELNARQEVVAEHAFPLTQGMNISLQSMKTEASLMWMVTAFMI